MSSEIESDIASPEALEAAAYAAEREAQEIEDSLAEARQAIKEAAEEAERIRKEMQAKLDEIATKKYQLETAIWDQQRAARLKRQEAESLKRQKAQAEAALKAQAEWATLEKRWDMLTIGAPWREWAKDHQLDGARKITYEGRMILGDTMGLGKTLTSLIAIDMIEAATKDASPDNPVEFGSMK